MTEALSCVAIATPFFWLALVIAASLGGSLGFLAAALCAATKDE